MPVSFIFRIVLYAHWETDGVGCGIALKPVLIQEGVYREYCSEDEVQKEVSVCFEQELRLNFMFTTAAVATNVTAIPLLHFFLGGEVLTMGKLGMRFTRWDNIGPLWA